MADKGTITNKGTINVDGKIKTTEGTDAKINGTGNLVGNVNDFIEVIGGTLTLGGSVTVQRDSGACIYAHGQSAKVVIDGATVRSDATETFTMIYADDGGSIQMKSGTVTCGVKSGYPGLIGVTANSTVSIEGGTLNYTGLTSGDMADALYTNGGGTINVSGGTLTVTGRANGISAVGGTVNISGGTITTSTTGYNAHRYMLTVNETSAKITGNWGAGS